MYPELFVFLFGLVLNKFQNIVGMETGMAGVEYYAEVHQSPWNSMVHSVCMPFTAYGTLLAVPNILFLNRKRAHIFHRGLYLFYIGHYLTMNVYITMVYTITYFFPMKEAIKRYQRSIRCLLKGFAFATTSLLIQEIIGHYLSGDGPSRLEAAPNTIMYAAYFASQNIVW